MTTLSRFSAALMLLFGCYGCESEDHTPGPADVFVGTWQGAGTGHRYSGENGEFDWDLDARATITRVNMSAVTVDSQALSYFCKEVYDIDDDGVGYLRPAPGEVYCDAGSLTLKDDVLSLEIHGTQNHLVYNESWNVRLALTRVP
jgi:hypothetical protein